MDKIINDRIRWIQVVITNILSMKCSIKYKKATLFNKIFLQMRFKRRGNGILILKLARVFMGYGLLQHFISNEKNIKKNRHSKILNWRATNIKTSHESTSPITEKVIFLTCYYLILKLLPYDAL